MGKSSLINRLAQRPDLARTSSTPGRTRSINFYLINEEFYIVDFPGYGYARVPEPTRRSWRKLAGDYFTARSNLSHCLMIVDMRREAAMALDLQLLEWLKHLGIPHTVVATKSDKLSSNARSAALAALGRAFGGLTILRFSAKSGEGREEVLREMHRALARPAISIA